MRLKIWSVLFAISVLSSCAHPGPVVVACVVDNEEGGFDCVQTPNIRFFIPWDKGEDLECASPDDLELELKACKAGSVLPITKCTLDLPHATFNCLKPSGQPFTLAFKQAENYLCMNASDQARLLQRCHKLI